MTIPSYNEMTISLHIQWNGYSIIWWNGNSHFHAKVSTKHTFLSFSFIPFLFPLTKHGVRVSKTHVKPNLDLIYIDIKTFLCWYSIIWWSGHSYFHSKVSIHTFLSFSFLPFPLQTKHGVKVGKTQVKPNLDRIYVDIKPFLLNSSLV